MSLPGTDRALTGTSYIHHHTGSTPIIEGREGAGVVLQLAEYLKCKHEDLRLDPQLPCQKARLTQRDNPNSEEGEMAGSRGSLDAVGELWFSDTLFQNLRRRVIEEDTNVDLRPPHAHV